VPKVLRYRGGGRADDVHFPSLTGVSAPASEPVQQPSQIVELVFGSGPFAGTAAQLVEQILTSPLIGFAAQQALFGGDRAVAAQRSAKRVAGLCRCAAGLIAGTALAIRLSVLLRQGPPQL
jgi:hypothetical protein